MPEGADRERPPRPLDDASRQAAGAPPADPAIVHHRRAILAELVASANLRQALERVYVLEVAPASDERRARMGKQGDPKASARALFKVVDAQEPPLRVFFGAAPRAIAKADYAKRLEDWKKWQPVALEAQGE